MRKISEIQKDIQSKRPELTDDVLELLTEYFIVQISDMFKEDVRKIGLSSAVFDVKC